MYNEDWAPALPGNFRPPALPGGRAAAAAPRARRAAAWPRPCSAPRRWPPAARLRRAASRCALCSRRNWPVLAKNGFCAVVDLPLTPQAELPAAVQQQAGALRPVDELADYIDRADSGAQDPNGGVDHGADRRAARRRLHRGRSAAAV